jgi:hypothetical protein
MDIAFIELMMAADVIEMGVAGNRDAILFRYERDMLAQ